MTGFVVVSLVAVFAAGAAVGVFVLVVIGIRSEDIDKILGTETRTRSSAAARLIVNVHLRRPEFTQDEEGQR